MAVIINGSNTPTAGSVTYGDGSTYANTASGTAGQVLTSAGAGAPVWATPFVPVVGFTAKTTTYTAVSGDTLLVDTSAGAFTITLPATPTTGNIVYFQDSKGTFLQYPLTIARNGQTIMGLAEDLIASNNNVGFGLVYNGSDWRIY